MPAHAFMFQASSILNEAKNQIEIGDIHNGNFKAAIKNCVSAIESFMNEIEAIGIGYTKNGYSPQHKIVKMGAELTRLEKEHKSSKIKIQAAYEVLTGKEMAKGDLKAYQHFSLVLDVRNELSHPKASIIELTKFGIVLSKKGQKLLNKLKSNGFGLKIHESYNWIEYINNKEFALWSLQVAVGIIKLIFSVWPFKAAAQSYIDMYCGDLA